jgi:PAS domain S-box-containing protein
MITRVKDAPVEGGGTSYYKGLNLRNFNFELLAHFVNPVLVIDTDKRVRFVNPAFEKLTGYDAGSVIGTRSPFPWWPRGTARSYTSLLRRVMNRGISHYEHRFKTKDGKEFWVAITFTPVIDNGQVVAYISNWIDVTARQLKNLKITEELYRNERRLRQKLEKEIAQRGNFFKMLVHELKTPLTATLFSSEILCDKLEDETTLKLARNIYRSVNILNNRITDLLDYTKGEVGMLNLQSVEIDVLRLLSEIVDDFSVAAAQQGKLLKLDVPAHLPTISFDSNRIRQVLQNLIDNSLKFTNEGDLIILRAKVGENAIVFTVEDTGRGISQDEQKGIFSLYYRVRAAGDYHGGLGLGLALCKMLVELHGGDIWAESEPGKGARFSFSLPLQKENNSIGHKPG